MVIVGRDAEVARLRDLVDGASRGRGGAVAVVGTAGIGKSSLAEAAVPAGAVRLYGVQAERDLPYAAVSALVTPLLAHLRDLADPQREALESILGLRQGHNPGRLILGLAVLNLLATAAETEPLVVLVDDLQWIDPPSQDALVFVARRLTAESIAMLFTMRATPGDPLIVDGLPRVDLTGLPVACAAALLPGVHPTVATTLQDRTGGNPLAMLEAAQSLTAEESSGRRSLPELLAVTRPEQVYAGRLAGLPGPARTAARLAALAGQAPREVFTAALADARLSFGDLSAVEATGLMSLSDRIDWRHPLARSAAARGTSTETAQAHGSLARAWTQVVPGNPARAWHLAGSVTGTDREASDALVAAAELAERRDASADAADAYEAAARLCPDLERRSTLFGHAGAAATRAGLSQRAADLIDEALDHPTDTASEAWLRCERGRLEAILGRPDRAYELLLQAIELSSEPGLRVWAAHDAFEAARLAGRPERAQHAAELAAASHRADDPVQLFLSEYLAAAAARLNGDLTRCRRLMDSARSLMERESLLERHPSLLIPVLASRLDAIQPMPLEPTERFVLDRLRLSGDLTILPRAIRLAATRESEAGLWAGVYVAHEESELLCRLSGQPVRLVESLVALAEADAIRGDGDPCRARLREARDLITHHQLKSQEGWAAYAEAMVCLGAGDYRVAIPLLRTAVDRDWYRPWALPELIEAIRVVDSVAAAQAELARHPANHDRPWFPLARAMADPDDRAAAAAIEARFPDINTVFDKGRFRLAAGERLRRAGDRKAARRLLGEAAETFRNLSADPWLARAEAELRASGATLRRQAQGERLTSSEHRVATLVAEGRTNKEVAALLFLSPKTVDFHLGRAYRKLGVSNRTALSQAMHSQPS